MENINEAITLDDARDTNNFYAIFWGDGGDVIYLTCPVDLIKTNELVLYKLVLAIDEVLWHEDDGRDIYYEKFDILPSKVDDGKGVVLKDEIWFNDKINDAAKKIINGIISGELAVLDMSKAMNMLKEKLR